jgi:predicted phosphodiesterase
VIVHRRTPGIWVFSVDDHAVQLAWRLLHPGELHLRVTDPEIDATRTVTVDRHPGLTLLEGLPAGRQLTIEATGSALGRTRRIEVRTLGPMPGPRLCRIATISDLHLGARGFGHRSAITDPTGHPDPHAWRCAEAALDEAVAWGAERIVAKGDLTHTAHANEWRQFARLVQTTPVPVDALAGNHDHGPPSAVGWVPPPDAAQAFDLSMAQPLTVRDLPGLRIILAATTLAGRHGGTLAPVEDDVVDAAADADPEGAVLVTLHHQLHGPTGQEGWPPGIRRDESAAFLDRLGAVHPHVLVTSGHTHRHRRWERAGVTITQVGATKDYPGVWAGYEVYDGGMRQIVRRIARPDVVAWTDHTRVAAYGLWEHTSPGRLASRCFDMVWGSPSHQPASA